MEGIRICRRGYPNRVPFGEFFNRYKVLCVNFLKKLEKISNELENFSLWDENRWHFVLEKMLNYLKIHVERFKIGKTKIFCRVGLITEVNNSVKNLSKIFLKFTQARK